MVYVYQAAKDIWTDNEACVPCISTRHEMMHEQTALNIYSLAGQTSEIIHGCIITEISGGRSVSVHSAIIKGGDAKPLSMYIVNTRIMADLQLTKKRRCFNVFL